MASRLRTILLVSFVACHATVLSAGPSLHGLLGLDHGLAAMGEDGGGSPSHALGKSSHDCAACHLLSLAQHNPDAAVSFSTPQSGRVVLPIRVEPPRAESHVAAPPRAPPSAHSA